MSQKNTLWVVDAVKHLRFDFEDACGLDELLLALDNRVEALGFDNLPRSTKQATRLIGQALTARLLLILARAYDHPKEESHSINLIFDIIDKHKYVLSELLATERQEELFNTACAKFNSLDNKFTQGILHLEWLRVTGSISDVDYSQRKKNLKLVNTVRTPRNKILAHNTRYTPSLDRPMPTFSEVRSLLTDSLAIIEPLSEAIGGVAVPFRCVRDVKRQEAQEFWSAWKPI